MTPLLDVALDCIARGWHVFPCAPRGKNPLTTSGYKDATINEARVRAWWAKHPTANVGIATAASGLCVLDIDHGLGSAADLQAFARRVGVPETYTVRTGRRDGFGVQMYFRGEGLASTPWKDDGGESGDVRCGTGYVMAAGSIHPSGEAYEVLTDASLQEVPAYVRNLKPPRRVLDGDEPITEFRNDALTRIAGKLRNAGLSAAALEVALLQVNADRCTVPLEDEEVRRIAANVARYELPKADAYVTLGEAKTRPEDWRTLFHTRQETEAITEAEFLIRDFLQAESITGLIGPARARKSIVTLNVIHSLLTGEPLFGKFEVPHRPERVVYLCPESGLKSLGRRIRNMGLSRFVGDSFFYTSMNSDPIALSDPALLEAVRGSVLFIDTAIRFFDGDENSSQDMKLFGKQCHSLIRDGVYAVVLLHHTSKNTEGITLESGRGSGDFGGFLTCCWGTTLDDYEDAYNAHSLMTCVKQRDFQAESFKIAPSGNQNDFFLQYVEGSNNARVQVGAKAKVGKAKALAFIRSHPDMTGEQLTTALAAEGIVYSVSTIRTMLRDARKPGAGVTVSG